MFVRDSSGNWSEQAKLTPSDSTAGDQFGRSASIIGDTALVGAIFADGTGAAYVFERDASGSWSEQGKLTPSDATAASFGSSVSLSGDSALIGASGTNDRTGAAYVFVRDGSGNWSEQATLTASDGTAGDDFGSSASLDGDTALIGAPFNEPAGAAYVFVRDGSGNWSEQAMLTASDAEDLDSFGLSVSLGGDTALIGDSRNNDHTGAVYVFARDDEGDWSEEAAFYAPDETTGALGFSVSLSGSTAVAGAPSSDAIGQDEGALGAAYVLLILTPADAIEELIDSVEALDLQHGIERSLIAKLEAALQALEGDDTQTAINSLQDFINQVEAQAGQHIPQEDAGDLIASAQDIVNMLAED